MRATEGMWLPYMLSDREADMQNMGMLISAEEIYSVNNGSLKDAIVSFGGFCTGEIISDNGLVLTNHHCGYGAIQSHSSVEHNYLEDGFWAMSRAEELPNEGLFVRFVKYIEDVSVPMLEGVHDGMTEEEKRARMQSNMNAILERRSSSEDFEFEIKEIYYGNQFILIASVRYTDVRLVGAPPSSIGKYGADTDNWVWPRHTGDFSMFRIYADASNNPADFADNNVPFKPYRSLNVSISGTQPGDFTFVYGFPGRTEEYLPAIAVDQMMNELNPMNIAIRDIILQGMKSYMVESEEIDIQYASKYASTSNAWKKWIGQTQGVDKTFGIDSIRRAEARFQYALAQDNNLWNMYGNILPSLEQRYAVSLDLFKKRDRFIEIGYRGNEVIRFLWGMNRELSAAENGSEEAVNKAAESMAQRLSGFIKNYNASVDSTITYNLYRHWMSTAEEVPAFLIDAYGSPDGVDISGMYSADAFFRPTNYDAFIALLESDPAAAIDTVLNSEIYTMMKAAFGYYIGEVAPQLGGVMSEINNLQKDYMAAQMVVGDPSELYPDANSTMRITYGRVEGFVPRDGVRYNTHTYLDGVIAKYVPGDYEFDLPERMLELYAEKNYGRYATEDGRLPVCFIASNHTSGGNSGSPALDANGNLIGLNFDRVWEGTMSDVYFDEAICRNIMVDIRYVLWVVDVYAGAGHLVEEMNLVSE
ncbi:MAG: S46 family peptidase [Flavobacteriia bacterium]|nr:S46 family peptidase [Flavobacteriia bacterium]